MAENDYEEVVEEESDEEGEAGSNEASSDEEVPQEGSVAIEEGEEAPAEEEGEPEGDEEEEEEDSSEEEDDEEVRYKRISEVEKKFTGKQWVNCTVLLETNSKKIPTFAPGDSVELKVKIQNKSARTIEPVRIYIRGEVGDPARLKCKKVLRTGLHEYAVAQQIKKIKKNKKEDGGENEDEEKTPTDALVGFPLAGWKDWKQKIVYVIPKRLETDEENRKDWENADSIEIMLDVPVKRTFGHHHLFCPLPIELAFEVREEEVAEGEGEGEGEVVEGEGGETSVVGEGEEEGEEGQEPNEEQEVQDTSRTEAEEGEGEANESSVVQESTIEEEAGASGEEEEAESD